MCLAKLRDKNYSSTVKAYFRIRAIEKHVLGTDLPVLWSHFDLQGTAAKGIQHPPVADGSSGSTWQSRARWVQPHTKRVPESQLFVLLLKTDCFSFTLDFCTFLPLGMHLQQPHMEAQQEKPSPHRCLSNCCFVPELADALYFK